LDIDGYENVDVGNITSIDITTIYPDNTYYYRVSGYNVTGTGEYSNVITVTTLPDPPPALTGLSASSCNNEVFLQWNQSTEWDFVQYNVYYGTEANPTTLLESYAPESYNAVTKEDLTNGQTYYFRVTQVISPGVESEYSNNISVRVKTGVIPHIKAKWGNVLICYDKGDSISGFRWYHGGTLISSATMQYYVTNKSPGSYYVETTDNEGCINSSNVIDIGGGKSISVYPNPAKSSITLSLSSEVVGETVVTLYNSAGVKSLEYRTDKKDTELNCEIPLKNLNDGTYTVEVIINNEEIDYTRLIIIE
jgi:hypothetical protein